jgi:hypothetical protein
MTKQEFETINNLVSKWNQQADKIAKKPARTLGDYTKGITLLDCATDLNKSLQNLLRDELRRDQAISIMKLKAVKGR